MLPVLLCSTLCLCIKVMALFPVVIFMSCVNLPNLLKSELPHFIGSSFKSELIDYFLPLGSKTYKDLSAINCASR